jgi:hypothetical protein
MEAHPDGNALVQWLGCAYKNTAFAYIEEVAGKNLFTAVESNFQRNRNSGVFSAFHDLVFTIPCLWRSTLQWQLPAAGTLSEADRTWQEPGKGLAKGLAKRLAKALAKRLVRSREGAGERLSYNPVPGRFYRF